MLNLITVVSIHTNSCLLKQFVSHYIKLGVDQFFVILHVDFNEVSNDSYNIKKSELESVLKEFGLSFFDTLETVWHPKSKFYSILKAKDTLPFDNWVSNLDVDEFVVFDDLKKLLNENTAGLVKGVFVDRITSTGILEEIDPNKTLWDQFPVDAQVTKKILNAPIQKIIAYKAKFTCAAGHHVLIESDAYHPDFRWLKIHPVYHFKWHAGVIDTVKRRVETYKSLGERRELESIRFLEYINKNGRILKEDVL